MSPASTEAPASDFSLEQPHPVLSLQRQIGNRGVNRLIAAGRAPGAASRVPGAVTGRPAIPQVLPKRPPSTRVLPSAALSAAGTINRSLIQFKKTMVVSETTTRIRTKDLTADPKKDLKAVAKGKKGKTYKRSELVDVKQYGHSKDADGNIVWYRVTPSGSDSNANEFIQANTILAGFNPESDFDAKTRGGEKDGPVGGAIDGIAELGNAIDDPLVETARSQDLEVEKWKEANPDKDPDTTEGAPSGSSTGLVQAEGAVWLGAGIFGMASSLKDLADNDKDGWEKVTAAMNLMASTSGVIGSISQITGTLQEDGSAAQENSAAFGAWGLGYQEMFTGLAAGVKTIKGVVDIVKMITDENKHSSAEWVKATGALLIAGLETAKGVLRSIRQISETLGGAVTEQFAQVLPGLDIAMAAVKSVVQGYYLVVSAIALHRMRMMKKELKKNGQGDVGGARTVYKNDAARTAQLEAMVREKDAKIDKAKKKKAAEKNPKKQALLQEKIDKLTVKRDAYNVSLAEAVKAGNDHETEQLALGGPDREGIEEYDLAATLMTTNKRRVTRQAVHITANLVAIAASIATLVSGPGAPAAVALKAAALGIDMSLPFFRWVKQAGRNTASRNTAKGEEGIANKIFNGDKSDVAKLDNRKKQAVVMLKMIARLNPLIDAARNGDPAATKQLKEQGSRVKLYLTASGVETNELFGLNGQPTKQIMLMVKAMAQRELD